jgi:hypothetical protein
VSRVSPVHTVLRNCTRDEGRSFEVGNQVLISSHASCRGDPTLATPHGAIIALHDHPFLVGYVDPRPGVTMKDGSGDWATLNKWPFFYH